MAICPRQMASFLIEKGLTMQIYELKLARRRASNNAPELSRRQRNISMDGRIELVIALRDCT
ncbi:hypothetical protein C8J56DRAFT_1162578 [Mycena floridula]|nr:hypothetical protein C8J56DRAFT_1171902 [Mycena floridula]KAJ7592130.1 hypothetical protein C8J56DRAFT_1162578 [Mycena floridula]